jgi:hypothetical protein
MEYCPSPVMEARPRFYVGGLCRLFHLYSVAVSSHPTLWLLGGPGNASRSPKCTFLSSHGSFDAGFKIYPKTLPFIITRQLRFTVNPDSRIILKSSIFFQ